MDAQRRDAPLTMETQARGLDVLDRRIIGVLDRDPRSTTAYLAERLRSARRTIQLRLARLEDPRFLRAHSTRVRPQALGYRQIAFISAEVEQAQLNAAVDALMAMPEVLRVSAVAGEWDVVCEVVATGAESMYDVGQRVLAAPGIRRTTTAMVLRELVPYRMNALVEHGAR